MVEHLNRSVKEITARMSLVTLVAIVPLIASSFAYADTLRDPTRPPASLGVPVVDGNVAQPSGLQLQSVLIGPGRVIAVISGQTVRVGDKVGEAQVVEIRESEVVLRTGKELRMLKLFPDIDKRLVFNRAPVKTDNRRQ